MFEIDIYILFYIHEINVRFFQILLYQDASVLHAF